MENTKDTLHTKARVIASLKLPLFTAHEWPCAECGGRLILIPQNNQPIYQCENSMTTGCQGTASAHEDGTPMGIPIDTDGKIMRRLVHNSLDEFWIHQRDKKAARTAVYDFMHAKMGDTIVKKPSGGVLVIREFHVAYLLHDDLRKAMWLIQNELPKYF